VTVYRFNLDSSRVELERRIAEYAGIDVECSKSSQMVDLAADLLTRANQFCHGFESIRRELFDFEVDDVIVDLVANFKR
jgi:hypothetical protein